MRLPVFLTLLFATMAQHAYAFSEAPVSTDEPIQLLPDSSRQALDQSVILLAKLDRTLIPAKTQLTNARWVEVGPIESSAFKSDASASTHISAVFSPGRLPSSIKPTESVRYMASLAPPNFNKNRIDSYYDLETALSESTTTMDVNQQETELPDLRRRNGSPQSVFVGLGLLVCFGGCLCVFPKAQVIAVTSVVLLCWETLNLAG